jgi:hypothetical protein
VIFRQGEEALARVVPHARDDVLEAVRKEPREVLDDVPLNGGELEGEEGRLEGMLRKIGR